MPASNYATPKMVHCISLIEHNLNIECTSTTFEEDSKFIADNLDQSKQAAREHKKRNKEIWNGINSEEGTTLSGLVPEDVGIV